MVEVTQEDREAAANLYLELEGEPYSPRDLAVADEHRRGLLDDHASIIAFAAHRQAAFNAGRASVLAEQESPTEAMVNATRGIGPNLAATVWKAMIGAYKEAL